MKKVILGSLVLSGFLFACDKANVQSDYQNGVISTENNSYKAQHGDPPKKLAKSRDVNGNDVYCDNPGFTCRMSGPVSPQDVNSIEEIMEADEARMPSVFASNVGHLAHYFSKEMVDGIINGTLRLEINGEFKVGSTTYFSFYSGSIFLQCAPLVK